MGMDGKVSYPSLGSSRIDRQRGKRQMIYGVNRDDIAIRQNVKTICNLMCFMCGELLLNYKENLGDFVHIIRIIDSNCAK